MPFLERSFVPPLLFKNPHLNTIIPNSIRKINGVTYNRERLELPDGDFIDLDFSVQNSGNKSLVLILHGLEGNSKRAYAKSIVKESNRRRFDACVINFRGCSGESNRLWASYHSGKTDDLKTVIEWLIDKKEYQSIHLVGVSVGGNIALKYLGEEGGAVPNLIRSAVAISAPVNLEASAIELERPGNFIYMYRFLKSLKQKTIEKMGRFPDSGISPIALNACKNFEDFDNLYTAPSHGYENARDYWMKNSSISFIPEIKIPSLLINASDDPFLNKDCFPINEARSSKNFNLLISRFGGHVGFVKGMPLSGPQYLEAEIFNFFGNY